MSDREELLELLARYASIADARDFDELPSTVFTERVELDFEALGPGPAVEVERDVLNGWQTESVAPGIWTFPDTSTPRYRRRRGRTAR